MARLEKSHIELIALDLKKKKLAVTIREQNIINLVQKGNEILTLHSYLRTHAAETSQHTKTTVYFRNHK